MNIGLYLLNAAALAAAINHSVFFPKSSPTAIAKPEPLFCAAANYTNYVVGPRPTGTLAVAMASHTSELFQTREITRCFIIVKFLGAVTYLSILDF